MVANSQSLLLLNLSFFNYGRILARRECGQHFYKNMTTLNKITILYEDENLLIINKPAGLVVHADGRTKEKTLADWILDKYPDMKDVGEPIMLPSGNAIYRPGIVHRLDRDTSGVMVLAKKQSSFEYMKELFQNREVHKKYHAFVYGIVKADDATIDRPIARSRKDFRKWSAQRGARGDAKEAVTYYRVLSRLEDVGATLVEAEPKTGRTHQIRVHFKAINHPVVCDSLYAPKGKPLLGFERLALHSRSIEFADKKGNQINITAPYPSDFKSALASIPEEASTKATF